MSSGMQVKAPEGAGDDDGADEVEAVDDLVSEVSHAELELAADALADGCATPFDAVIARMVAGEVCVCVWLRVFICFCDHRGKIVVIMSMKNVIKCTPSLTYSQADEDARRILQELLVGPDAEGAAAATAASGGAAARDDGGVGDKRRRLM